MHEWLNAKVKVRVDVSVADSMTWSFIHHLQRNSIEGPLVRVYGYKNPPSTETYRDLAVEDGGIISR